MSDTEPQPEIEIIPAETYRSPAMSPDTLNNARLNALRNQKVEKTDPRERPMPGVSRRQDAQEVTQSIANKLPNFNAESEDPNRFLDRKSKP